LLKKILRAWTRDEANTDAIPTEQDALLIAGAPL